MVKTSPIETRNEAANVRRRSMKRPAQPSTGSPRKAPAGYAIGYGRPPTWTQFGPGQSGNAKGRPKTNRSQKASMARETLERKVAIKKDGAPRKVSLRQLAFERIGEQASAGDIQSANFLLAREKEEQHLAPNQFPVSEETALEILREYFAREPTHNGE